MKRLCLLTLTIGFVLFAASSWAVTPSVLGNIEPVSNERISVLIGDKAKITLGTREGLIKGDIGTVSTDRDLSPEKMVGQCAVTKTNFENSICELIRGRREVEKGDIVSFDSVSFSDPNFYSVVMTTLADVVDPYEPYKKLNVCIYGVFDKSNAVTALSQELKTEFEKILSQKKRIHLVSTDVFKNLVLYPGVSSELLVYLKNQMKKVNVDALVLARYLIDEGRVKVTVQKIDQGTFDNTVTYALPVQPKYANLSSTILLTPSEMTKVRNIGCNILFKSLPKFLPREDRLTLIKSESAGDALVEQSLRAIDFNMVNPIDVKAVVDGETVDLSDKQVHSLLLSTGSHTIDVSLRRGYFYNDTLLYTSANVDRKEAILNLSTDTKLDIEVSVNPVQLKDPISLLVFHSIHRQRQVLKPIQRVESDRTVEVFKE
jgi:hypothetical protein